MTIRYLHLSDLHLTSKDEAKDPVKAFNQRLVTKSMLSFIKDLQIKPDFLIITGDIAQKGTAEEYLEASSFCDNLLDVTGLEKDRLFIVPGNHDVNRSDVKPKHIKGLYPFETQDEITETLTDPDVFPVIMRKFAAFNAFSSKVTGREQFTPSEFCFSETLDLGTCRINMIGLNSCLFAGYDGDEQQKLALGLYQVDQVMEDLEKDALSIVFFHHPFHCYHPEDAVSQNILMNRSNLILTGHLHKPSNAFIHNAAGQAVVIGAGAGFETRKSSNSFNIVEIDPESRRGRVQFYKYLPDHNRWRTDADVNPDAPDGSFSFVLGGKHGDGSLLRHSEASGDNISLKGSGAISRGNGNVVSGAGGISVRGDVHGGIHIKR